MSHNTLYICPIFVSGMTVSLVHMWLALMCLPALQQGESPNVRFPRILGIEACGVVEEAPSGEFAKVCSHLTLRGTACIRGKLCHMHSDGPVLCRHHV